MTKASVLFLAVIAILVAPKVLSSMTSNRRMIARGKYLVENAAMCGDCHTPHLQNGQPDRARWLEGATLEFKPLHPMPWANKAPAIAGLPGLTVQQATKLLETGLLPNGQRLLPPMPQFRFSHADAEAIAAYLASLKQPSKASR